MNTLKLNRLLATATLCAIYLGMGAALTGCPPTESQQEPFSTQEKLTAGSRFYCHLSNSGKVHCWGSDSFGQMGYDASVTLLNSSYAPLPIHGLPDTVSDIAAGSGHVCALSEGEVWCWGWNANLQLAMGNKNPGYASVVPTPFHVPGFSGVSKLALGEKHTCALKTDGTVWCWGYGVEGQLGDAPDTTFESGLPTQVSLGSGKAIAIAAGDNHNCALKDDKTVWCWGRNTEKQLGNNPTALSSTSPTPVQVKKLPSDAVDIQAGGNHSCALMGNDGSTWCWGENNYCQSGSQNNFSCATVGLPTLILKFNPDAVPSATTGIIDSPLIDTTQISLSADLSCGVNHQNQLYCWGNDTHHILGTSTLPGVKVSSQEAIFNNYMTDSVKSVAAGVASYCVIRTDSTVWCLGWNDSGEIANGHENVDEYVVPFHQVTGM